VYDSSLSASSPIPYLTFDHPFRGCSRVNLVTAFNLYEALCKHAKLQTIALLALAFILQVGDRTGSNFDAGEPTLSGPYSTALIYLAHSS